MAESRKNDTSLHDEIYSYIVEYTTQHLYPPSYREILAAADCRSLSTVHWHVRRLAEEGKLIISSGESRTITLTGYSLVPEK